MTHQHVPKAVHFAAALSTFIASSLLSAAAIAGDRHEGIYMSRVIESVVATGLNDVMGEAPFNLGEPFGTFGFAMLAIHNPGAAEPLPLSESTSRDDLLVTVAHPNFLLIAGKTRADVQPGWENIPLRQVPINVDFASIATAGNGLKAPLRPVLQADPLEVAQAEPADPITVRRWMKGRGILKIVCQSKERATLKMTVRNLLPNRMYGIGATMGGLNASPPAQRRLAPFTIGGVPHVFVTDEHGDGQMEREIKFCPLDPTAADQTVLVMNLLHYSRHQNYGAVPEPVFVNGLWLGMVTHNHLQFPVNVEFNPLWSGLRRR